MTCIVAYKKNGVVYMGADSAGVGYYSLTVRKDPKIYKNGEYMFGFTDSFRMGQLLGFSFNAPTRPENIDDYKFMVTSFIDAVRQCLKAGGYAEVNNNQEKGGTFIVAYRNNIYEVYGDFQVGMTKTPFCSVGCGFELAVGAMHALTDRVEYGAIELHPKEILRLALETAQEFSAGVRGPFIYDQMGEEKTPIQKEFVIDKEKFLGETIGQSTETE